MLRDNQRGNLWTPAQSRSGRYRRRNRRSPERSGPPLRFSPGAWAKLLWLRDAGPTEIGGFAVTPADDLLYVEDVRLVRQSCTAVSVAFDDESVAELFDELVDGGRRPEQFARIWVHTHPADSAWPSSVDERTFERVFGRCEWSLMFILAQGGETYARLQFQVGPSASVRVPVLIDWSLPLVASDPAAWQAEYRANVNDLHRLELESKMEQDGLNPEWVEFLKEGASLGFALERL